MDNRCYFCKKKIKDGDEYTSISKGIYSEDGDKEWIALIFHDSCWAKMGKGADPKLAPLFKAEPEICLG